MSENIEQIYIANPITVNAATDLMYFGQSPYGATDDAAMNFANFNAQIVATGTTSALGYYASAGNKISAITTVDNGVLVTGNTGVPAYLANSGTPGYVLTANTAAPPSWQAVSSSGAITTLDGDSGSATPNAGVVTISGGSSGLTTTGASHTISLGGVLAVGYGGLGITTTPSNGQIPIGNGTNYTAATITPGDGISISNGSGTITIAATGSGITWSNIIGTTQAAVVDNIYVCTNSSQTIVTLPATASLGSVVGVEGLGVGGWILAANTGQTIKIGTGTTSSAGSLTSAAASDNVYVVCIVANTTWRVQFTNSQGLTIA